MLKHEHHRYDLRKKFFHSCKLPVQVNIKTEEYFSRSCYLIKQFRSSCIITNDVSYRQIYAKSYKVLEKERHLHMEDFSHIIHPFSTFAYYWELLMILLFLVQLSLTPVLIILRIRSTYSINFILITQILACLNILVSSFTGRYNTDIKEVTLDQKQILLDYIKSGQLIIELLASIPFAFIAYQCGASIPYELFLSCFVLFNICPLLRYLEFLRQKRGYSFMLFRLFDALIVFLLGIFWLTVFIFVGSCLDHRNETLNYNVNIWWWVYNTYAFMDGTEISTFCFIGYEFGFSALAIIFGILIRNIIIVQLIIMCKIWYSTQRKRVCLFKELDEFCHYKRLPFSYKKRLIKYYNFKFRNVYYNETEIKNQLSENLRFNIQEYISRAWFEADIFKLCPLPLRQLITLHLDEEIFFNNDIIYNAGEMRAHIYFIKSGSILRIREDLKEMFKVVEGNFFSEQALLPEEAPHLSTVIALESCRLFKLSRENFSKIIQNFHTSYVTILDIMESRRHYLLKGIKLKTRLRLGDYYHISRRNTDPEET